MEEKIQREYSIPFELFAKAFTLFQHKFVYPRCWCITVLLGAVIAVYVSAALKDPTNTMTYLLIFACLAVIFIQWFNPRKIRRQLLAAIRELGDETYRLTVEQEQLTIATILPEPEAEEPEEEAREAAGGDGFHDIFPEEPPRLEDTVIPFGKHVKILETQELFLVYQVRSMFYVIPKDAFSPEENRQLSALFAEKLGRQFYPDKHRERN